jgi:hypothetical protein
VAVATCWGKARKPSSDPRTCDGVVASLGIFLPTVVAREGGSMARQAQKQALSGEISECCEQKMNFFLLVGHRGEGKNKNDFLYCGSRDWRSGDKNALSGEGFISRASSSLTTSSKGQPPLFFGRTSACLGDGLMLSRCRTQGL